MSEPTRKSAAPWRSTKVTAVAGAIVASLTVTDATSADPATGRALEIVGAARADTAMSVLTYNVKGLPWPAASGRPQPLAQIGARLAAMRRTGRQPDVVVLQEAFTPEAKAIGDRAGYAWQVQGPYARIEPGNSAGGSWYLGETQPAVLDSGLTILSDFPVLDVARAAFGPGDCAGYDCLAAKGILLVTVAVPGQGPVTIATTHFNSRKASGAPFARANAAYNRQAAFAARAVRRLRHPTAPMVFAGDFNRGDRPTRIAALGRAVSIIGGASDALSLLFDDDERLRQVADLATIHRGGRDLQFAFDGSTMAIRPIAVEVPFGSEVDGGPLSDHFGYTVHYRVASAAAPPRLASAP